MDKLALLGGTPSIKEGFYPESLFKWPIVTQEDEDAVLEVFRRNAMSGTDVTEKFQEEFAAWQGRKHAICYCNGTMALSAAMFAIKLGAGDEIICPTKTYWGSCSQAMCFGASVVFANIDDTLCLDPNDLERCLSPRTKAIMVVHYFAHPCDMDPIMAFAKKHHLYVIEDVSHAHGGMYKGKKVGTFGDVAAMSMMSGKSFASGELGTLVCDDREMYERAMAYGHYERNNGAYITETEYLKQYYHIALGGVKGRANQLSTAQARVQLKYYDERTSEIRRAMNRFWDKVEEGGTRGLHAIRVDESTGSNMAGWYCPHGLYKPEEMGGLSASRFCEAIRAEAGFQSWPGGNFCLNTHMLFKNFDFFGLGKPSRIVFDDRDVRELDDALKPSEAIQCVSMPWFKHFEPEYIDACAAAVRKVCDGYEQLLDKHSDNSEEAPQGRWYGTTNK